MPLNTLLADTPVIGTTSSTLLDVNSRRGSTMASRQLSSFTLNEREPEDTTPVSKLKNVESQRMMAVLQEVVRKISYVSLVPDVVDKRVVMVVGDECGVLLNEFRTHENKLSELITEKESHARAQVNDPPSLAADIKETSKQLRAATRSLCRYLTNHPAMITKLRYLKSNKVQSIASFERTLGEMKSVVYERLKTSVEEEKAKQDQMSSIIAKEQKTSNEVKALQDQLDKAVKERTFEITRKNETIQKLKDELRYIKNQVEEISKRFETRSKQKEDLEMQKYKTKEAVLLEDIAHLEKEYVELRMKNRDEEIAMRKKKGKIENEVEAWIAKYDQDMLEKQAELDEINAIYSEEKTQLDELMKRYDTMNEEWKKIEAERAVAAAKQREIERFLQRQSFAATKIQAIWRGYITRLTLKGGRKAPPKKKK